MKCSLEVYGRFREELNKLLTKGDNLLEEDEFLIELISNSKNPGGVLDLAREMKEEGSLLFKEGRIGDALEKYGYAGVILGCFIFEKEEHISNFYDLAICILLNSAICFSKKNEFEQVGLICSIILEFNPNNVKALYRRAIAAAELGRSDFAYWDLLLAHEVDPSNREVVEKLEKIKPSHMVKKKKNHAHDTIPLGLGLGLPDCQKRVKRSLVERLNKENDQVLQEESIKDNSEGKCDFVLGKNENVRVGNHAAMEDVCLQDCSSGVEDNQMNKDADIVETEIIEDCESVSNFESSNMTEPKYRFVNRKRPGSSLTISEKDYMLLRQGKSIRYYNSRLGSPMVIRVVPRPRRHPEKSGETKENNLIDPTLSAIVDSVYTKPSQHQDNDDLEMEERLPESKESDEKSEVKNNFSDTVMASQCPESDMGMVDVTSCTSSVSDRQSQKGSYIARRRKGVARSCVKGTMKVQSRKTKKILSCTHTVSACRSVGIKRKLVGISPDLTHRPRKKSFSMLYPSSSVSNSFESCLMSASSKGESCIMEAGLSSIGCVVVPPVKQL
ncbi:hypothetical protein SOVF_079340 [Spinacia oleracea]|nr:hypothetical protein SOVF_079340 [Spinacia oleracea]